MAILEPPPGSPERSSARVNSYSDYYSGFAGFEFEVPASVYWLIKFNPISSLVLMSPINRR